MATRQLEIGDFNRRVSVQNPASTADGTTYSEVRQQWVSIEPIGASKLVFLSAQGSKVTHLIMAREKPALAVGQRLVYRGVNYQITAVQNFIGDHQEAEAELLQ